MIKKRNADLIRVKGCPVSVAEQVLTLVYLGKLNNPYLDPNQAIPFTSCYLNWRTRTMFKRLFGEPYNVEGPTHRGDARPPQNLPPPGDPGHKEQPVDKG